MVMKTQEIELVNKTSLEAPRTQRKREMKIIKVVIVNTVERSNRKELQIKTTRRRVRTYETETILKKNTWEKCLI